MSQITGKTLSFEPKHFLKSKTIQGALAALLGAVIGYFGLPVADTEVASATSAVLELAGVVWVIVGRVTAKQPITAQGGGAGKPLLLILLVPAFLFGAGCAGLQALTSSEQAAVVAHQSALTYESLHAEYLQLEQTLPPDGVAYIHGKIAPALDKAKHSQIAFESAVLVWRRTQVEPDNLAALRADVTRCLTEAAALLAGLTGKSKEHSDDD